ncbi:MAG TPA: STAS domain-containing protein [Acidimicrobiales bacterium]|nr:STAS domain-containing protein [Acidimicrobiales bacterium]
MAGSDKFEITVDEGDRRNGSRLNSSAVLAVVGEVDMATSPVLWDALLRALRTGDVTVDVADVALIDATGVGVLVRATDQARNIGRALTVRAPSPTVRRVLEAADPSGFLHVED